MLSVIIIRFLHLQLLGQALYIQHQWLNQNFFSENLELVWREKFHLSQCSYIYKCKIESWWWPYFLLYLEDWGTEKSGGYKNRDWRTCNGKIRIRGREKNSSCHLSSWCQPLWIWPHSWPGVKELCSLVINLFPLFLEPSPADFSYCNQNRCKQNRGFPVLFGFVFLKIYYKYHATVFHLSFIIFFLPVLIQILKKKK